MFLNSEVRLVIVCSADSSRSNSTFRSAMPVSRPWTVPLDYALRASGLCLRRDHCYRDRTRGVKPVHPGAITLLSEGAIGGGVAGGGAWWRRGGAVAGDCGWVRGGGGG